MRLSVDGWLFDVDITRTMAQSTQDAQDHCTCGYCRNFYQSIDSSYPGFRGVLGQFGVNLEAPELLFPLEPTVYFAAYRVWGKVLRKGRTPLALDSVPLRVDEQEHSFLISTGAMKLPWVLEEAMEDVISPVNDPEVFWEMFDDFLPDVILDS